MVAPAAAFYMRTYRVLPSEVVATGPKGVIVRSDVLDFVEKHKLEKGRAREGTAASGKKPAEAAKKPAKKEKPAAAGQSAAYDPAHPFKQSWEDQALPTGYDQVAQSIANQKRYVAHTYMSSKCDVTAITAQLEAMQDESVSFESFLLKAAAKAFSKAFPEVEAKNIARVV